MILWLPGVSDELVHLATPADRLAVDSVVPVVWSKKLTVPVGVPLLGVAAATVAVSVTDWPKNAGFAEDVNVVLVRGVIVVPLVLNVSPAADTTPEPLPTTN